MVEVFKTNVQEAYQAESITRELLEHFPNHRIHFDLEDSDRILRIEGTSVQPEKIIEYLALKNYFCELLGD